MNTSTYFPGEEAAASLIAKVLLSFSPSHSTPPLLQESWQHYQHRTVLCQGHLLPCNWADSPMQDPMSRESAHSIHVYRSFCLTCLLSTQSFRGDMKKEQSCDWLDTMSEDSVSCDRAHSIQVHCSVGHIDIRDTDINTVDSRKNGPESGKIPNLEHFELWLCTQHGSTPAVAVMCLRDTNNNSTAKCKRNSTEIG